MQIIKTTNLLYLCCLLLFFCSCANYTARKTTAFEQIETLKNNFLLVRLKTEDKKIAALEKTNRINEAKLTRQKLADENNAIFNCFKNNFTFSKVYFFEGRDAKYLRQKQFDNIQLYDVNKAPVADNNFYLLVI